VADSRGDFPDIPESEFGFYVDGTRFLSQLELVMHGHPPLVLNAALSEDTLQIAVDLTNPDILHDGGIALPGRMLRIARLLTIFDNQLYQRLTVESFAEVSHPLTLTWHFTGANLQIGRTWAPICGVRTLTRVVSRTGLTVSFRLLLPAISCSIT
jgi:hypothetical protein